MDTDKTYLVVKRNESNGGYLRDTSFLCSFTSRSKSSSFLEALTNCDIDASNIDSQFFTKKEKQILLREKASLRMCADYYQIVEIPLIT